MVSRQLGFTVLIGHPRPGSRTHTVTVTVADLLGQALAASGVDLAPPHRIDLAELAPRLLTACGAGNGHAAAGQLSGAAEAALEAVTGRPLLLVATPTFRGGCSGLLKLFLDLLPRDGLRSVIAIPLVTAGIPAHRHTVDTTLRPVLLELRAQLPTAQISVLETELSSLGQIFEAWWAAAGAGLRHAIRAQAQATVRDEVASC